jgi:hypothetical protein
MESYYREIHVERQKYALWGFLEGVWDVQTSETTKFDSTKLKAVGETVLSPLLE